jgi:hypothetical protein
VKTAFLETTQSTLNPLDLVEEISASNDWSYDRAASDELLVEISGRWCDYSMLFAWQDQVGVIQFCSACELRVPPTRRSAVYELLAMINERLWVGHVGVSVDDNVLTFRHAVLLRGTRGATVEQLEDLVEIAVTELDRFYPAFQFVVWGGKTAGDAVTAAMLDPVGEA